MKFLDQATQEFVLGILGRVHDLALATLRPDGYPQATTVSFAHEGLTLYVAVGVDSQKIHNIRQDDRVSLTLTAPYAQWNQIQGLSMAGKAEVIEGQDELNRAAQCLQARFPEIKELAPDGQPPPWTGVAFIRIKPQVISILDYTKGFGHAELYAAQPA